MEKGCGGGGFEGGFAVAEDAKKGCVMGKGWVVVEVEVGVGMGWGAVEKEEGDVKATLGGEGVVGVREDLGEGDGVGVECCVSGPRGVDVAVGGGDGPGGGETNGGADVV